MTTAYGTVTVNATATQILSSNPSRKGCIINNNSSTLILYIGFDSSVSTTNGMPIPPNSYYYDSGTHDAWRGSVYGIAPSDTINVRYQEWDH
jgi:hypothetical protein